MVRWTGLAPWEFEFPFPGSLISTFRAGVLRDASGEKVQRVAFLLLLLYFSQA